MTAQPIFALVAGEASGDQLGATLIGDLKKACPDAIFVGIGGSAMRAAGMETWWDSEELAVFGLTEVLVHFSRLLGIRRDLQRRLLQLRPDAFIGIDAPDFNLGLEKKLKSSGIRTVHYVSPTVWAWRPKRVRKIARAADLVLCLFPFEPAFYRGHGVSAVYVGHPMADQIPLHSEASQARRALGMEEKTLVIALLPGSRASEVSRLSEPMIAATLLLAAEYPDAKFVAAIANQRVGEIFRNTLGRVNSANIQLVDGRPRTVIAAADVVMCASGTATLETMLINRPLVAAYRLATTTFYLARALKLVKSQFFALPNILAGEALVPELIQHEVTPERLAQEIIRWLRNGQLCRVLSARFEDLHRELLCDTKDRAAQAVTGLLRLAGVEPAGIREPFPEE